MPCDKWEVQKRRAEQAKKEFVYESTLLISLWAIDRENGDCTRSAAKNIIHRKTGNPVFKA